ncbi:MAG TPA: saccharopine dehydrogenase NADP-binding domain-containing protein, partial [Thermoanaerobaculia bacterium]
MKKVVVLGCGLVGGVMTRDLAADPNIEVTAVDLSEKNLGEVRQWPRVRAMKADLSSAHEIARAVRDADAVVGAVPGRIGFAMLRTVIESGKPIADISFAPEDPMQLDAAAKAKGVTAVVDCGVSPGLSNLAIGRAAAPLGALASAVIN